MASVCFPISVYSSPLCSLSLSVLLFLLCRSTLVFCNPLVTLRSFFSFYLALLLLPFCFLLPMCVCVFPCIHYYSSVCDVYLYMFISHIAVCVQWFCSKSFLKMQKSLFLFLSLPLSLCLSPSPWTLRWLCALIALFIHVFTVNNIYAWQRVLRLCWLFYFPRPLYFVLSHFLPVAQPFSTSALSLSLSLLWHFVPPYW